MPRIHLTFPSGGATARDASGIPGSAKRSEAEEVFCLEFRFFCTFPRRAAPLPPLRGPPSPEEKVCSHPLKVSGKILAFISCSPRNRPLLYNGTSDFCREKMTSCRKKCSRAKRSAQPPVLTVNQGSRILRCSSPEMFTGPFLHARNTPAAAPPCRDPSSRCP